MEGESNVPLVTTDVRPTKTNALSALLNTERGRHTGMLLEPIPDPSPSQAEGRRHSRVLGE